MEKAKRGSHYMLDQSEGEQFHQAAVYASIRALRKTPMHLSGNQAAMFIGAKQIPAQRPAKPLSIK
jgi:hypothetical protein